MPLRSGGAWEEVSDGNCVKLVDRDRRPESQLSEIVDVGGVKEVGVVSDGVSVRIGADPEDISSGERGGPLLGTCLQRCLGDHYVCDFQ